MSAALFIHVPTPGDHYSPATGSATMTVIYEMSRQHEAAGGQTRVVVGRGTRHDYGVGECAEVDFGTSLFNMKPSHKAADALLGRLGCARPFASRMYAPVRDAIARDFDGPLFLHNAPAALPRLRRAFPRSLLCLYAHNVLFRTYNRREIRRVLADADRVICVSEFLANDLAARLGERDPKIRVVHNGVDTARFRPPAAPPRNDVPVILFVGRVVPEKGPDLLLKAALKLHDGKRRFKVRIVGSSGFSATDPLSPYEQELRRLAEPLGNAVEFQPFVNREQVIREYQCADIFCAPANWDEPFGLTVLEAMACGLPVVASNRGGIPEAGGDAAHYFRPPNANDLAERLSNLIGRVNQRYPRCERAHRQALVHDWRSAYSKLVVTVLQRRGERG